MIDLKLTQSGDILLNANGDFETTGLYSTAIVTALHTDRDRNFLIDNETEGSYLYLHQQARIDTNRILRVKNDIVEALDFLQNIEEDVTANVKTGIERNKITYDVDVTSNHGIIFKDKYEL